MFDLSSFLNPGLAQVPAWLLFLSLLGVSLALIFAGRTIVKIAAFFIVGIAGALLGGSVGAHYLPTGGQFLGLLLGFVLGGLIGVALVAVGVGLAIGYAAYLIALDLAFSSTIALTAGVVFFVVGVALSGKVLSVVTAIAGGLLLFNILNYYGIAPLISTLLATLLTVAGLWVQLSLGRKSNPPTPVKAPMPSMNP
jgi:hypothetical protein